ncbi:TRAP transporter large permease [Shimia thalassica]|uniref:TRAP transporter large permease protein n=1 Tax=Shimia thalassica TaxID=1715693 RepID=A0A0P1ITA1_9RHOB|nr:TRAP transporter large permease [Shimia thalassica]MBU2943420.1 TRAP transporter large permease [Shimia thalassica]MDO6478776.1 TRAP transporter large permease [Shimia thalassica]MDO6501490.1 TRAP transporter large permease [Shimia thalassica]MDO6521867.1 TRAP transporter large permease [Shimia thalassica]MDP2493486.1 TRAP transporter large permease [Shimia thalassica]
MTAALIGFAIVLILVLVRLPIVFAMGLVGTLGFAYERGGSIFDERGLKAAMSMVGRQITDTAQDYGLSVVPLFILMGLFVNKGGMAKELYAVSNAFLGHMRGGIAMATVAACGGFSAICGSSLATAATMSKVAMPEMRRYGYSDELSTASIAAGGTLGILIPPSVILVIYGLLTETSIGKLFMAGILPGAMGILFYLFAVRWTVWRNPESGPAGERAGWGERLLALKSVWAVLLLFFLVIGGLYGAFDFEPLNLTFSPTEAAGMGAMGAFLIALSRGGLSIASTLEVLKETTFTAAALFSVLIGAQIFSNFINLAGLPEALIAMVTAYDVPNFMVILMILGIYIILGCVFESLSMLLLTVPIFFPLVVSLGYDPIWFGIVVVVVTEISLITPPVGLNVFILKGVVGDVSTATIFKGVTPFWIADIFRLALIVLIPWLVLVLPEQMGAMGH